MTRIRTPDPESNSSDRLAGSWRGRGGSSSTRGGRSDDVPSKRKSTDTQGWRRGGFGLNRAVTTGRPQQRCNNFANTGQCPHGDRCQFSHGETHHTPGQNIGYVDAPPPSVALTTPFPSLDCLDDIASDHLLVPLRTQAASKVDLLIASAKRNGTITRVSQTEDLLLGLVSSNLQNDRWVSLFTCHLVTG